MFNDFTTAREWKDKLDKPIQNHLKIKQNNYRILLIKSYLRRKNQTNSLEVYVLASTSRVKGDK